MTLQISQLASETGLSIHTLLYYEKEGNLPPAKCNGSGIRIYVSEDIEWIKFAYCLRDSGMGIAGYSKLDAGNVLSPIMLSHFSMYH
ncbi:HTH-type transcriptional regulator AdhR [compost metagenome]